ncbi:MAG: Fic family protein [Chlamydiales bacterium]|nr:Fic family protein [Chlamydiales bacterium]
MIRPNRPEKLPLRRKIEWKGLDKLLGEAYLTLGKFEALSATPEAKKIILSHLVREEALGSIHSHAAQKKVMQLKSYEKALSRAMRQISHRTISLTLMREIHGIVKKDLGEPRDIGRFRTRQNWIGPIGKTIESAYFLPPSPDLLLPSMKNLIHYLRISKDDKLLQIAIFTAQLLIVHPFMDGNGRVARVLIPLLFYKKKLLSSPLFFMSRYIKMNRITYFKTLYSVSENKDWRGWIEFFLKGVIEQGEWSCKQLLVKKEKRRISPPLLKLRKRA